MIRFENVSKSFKDIILFDNVSFTIPEKRKVLIKGVNGSGKSVLLKLMVGYSMPNSGKIFIDNYVLHENHDFIQNAGVSINAPEFIKSESGLDNLLELAKIRKVATKKDIISLATTLGLDKRLNKKYQTYSLGMKQKMRIIQAVMDKPKYLILDEPFDALDHKSCEIVLNILDEHVKNGGTLIFTSHTKDYEDFADHILEIEDASVNYSDL